MPFKEGHKLSGNRKGIGNKNTADLKTAIANFTLGKFETINTLYEELSPKEKADFLTKLLPYILSRLASIEATGANGEALNFTINLKPTDGSRDQQGVLPDTDRPE
jgi:hypothetical protein